MRPTEQHKFLTPLFPFRGPFQGLCCICFSTIGAGERAANSFLTPPSRRLAQHFVNNVWAKISTSLFYRVEASAEEKGGGEWSRGPVLCLCEQCVGQDKHLTLPQGHECGKGGGVGGDRGATCPRGSHPSNLCRRPARQPAPQSRLSPHLRAGRGPGELAALRPCRCLRGQPSELPGRGDRIGARGYHQGRGNPLLLLPLSFSPCAPQLHASPWVTTASPPGPNLRAYPLAPCIHPGHLQLLVPP